MRPSARAAARLHGYTATLLHCTLLHYYITIHYYTTNYTTQVAHFEALRKESGLGYSEMLFFDDAGFGKFGNCEV